MQSFDSLMSTVKKNSIFRFISSIRLAVPLMLILIAVVAWGTVIESQFNSEFSSLLIYKSEWFGLFLILLWINIFCATLSRYPFKKHHTGFIITHIGLLLLLIGGFMTNQWGIDGQLSVQEGQSSQTIVLPKLMVGYQIQGQSGIQKVVFSKMLYPKEQTGLSAIDDEIGSVVRLEKYLPFAKASRGFKSNPESSTDVALSFNLKSQFFNVTEWLSSNENPTMQMGPATLRLHLGMPNLKGKESAISKKKGSAKKVRSKKGNKVSGIKILVVSDSDAQNVKQISLADLSGKSINHNGMSIRLKKYFRAAVVVGNQLQENPDGSVSNPAAELEIEKDGKILREVLYASFKDFSLNKDGVFGYRMHLQADENVDGSFESNDQGQMEAQVEMSGPNSIKPGSRVIDFYVSEESPRSCIVVLSKDGEILLSQSLNEGEKLVTPWMGIEIFVGSIVTHSQGYNEVVEYNPEKRQELPPSAMLINVGEDQPFWLLEGDQKTVQVAGKIVTVYYGKELFDLPFKINLQSFTKVDYPGTQTAMSFESMVTINQENNPIKISMNEPYKKQGYTVYQASYIMSPGEQPVSVFSVNKDPGRFLKYLGSIILSLGIIIYTLMKSRLWKTKT